MIYNYKKALGGFFLKRELRNLKRDKQNFSLDSAHSIGVLYEYKDDEDFKVIDDLIHELKDLKKKVKVLAFIDGNNMLEYIPQKLSVDFFQKQDLSWYLSPKSTYLKSFTNTKFDILIDLNINKSFPLKYVSAISKSSYKVGLYDEDMKEILDLLIKPKKESNLRKLIQEILYFLKLLKTS